MTDPASARVGFVGLGNMGVPMAANLCDAGFKLTIFDANPDAVARFAAGHEVTGATEATALAHVDILILMLPNGVIVQDVLLGERNGAPSLASSMNKGSVVIDMSSSAPTGTRELGSALAARGIELVDAPVSGGVPRARNGTLAVMTGGDEGLAERLRPLFAPMASSVTHVGKLGSGHAMKALNNYVSAAGLVAACEALRLAQTFGIPGGKAIEVLNSSTGRNNSTENKLGQYVLSETFDSGFSLSLMRKDLAAALDLASDLRLNVPLGPALLSIWETGEATLGADADHTAIAKLIHDR
ncbi:NAD(P)-dependent oxidoreductase [Marinivivus vitaminiproducens]|nr:NAD(P)-dependent oxidoreductase [Geminicoccaceae bacterium SCSIO 64248]